MKRCFFFIALMVLLSSCVGTKQYARFVAKGIEKTDTTSGTLQTGTTIVTDSLPKFAPLVQIKKGNNYFIPAILYWGIKETYDCQLNPKLPVAYFCKSFIHCADSLHLSRVLNGRRLELSIKSVPSKFSYSETLDVFIFIFFYFGVDHKAITPKNEDLIIGYKLYNGDVLSNQGTVTVSDTQPPYRGNPNHSTKRATRKYLHEYERNIRKMARQSVVKLIDRIEGY